MKKIISVFLSVLLLAGACVSVFAVEPEEMLDANVLCASGVNEYGSNIYDDGVSHALRIPVYVVQEGKNITVSGCLDGKSFDVSLQMRGKNEAGNMVYFDSTCDEYEVLTAIYFNSYSEKVPIFKDEAANHNRMLRIYMKDILNDDGQENDETYYFIEIYDVLIDSLNTLVNDLTVEPFDRWYAREFLPVDTIVEQGEAIAVNRAGTYDEEWKITQVYNDPALLTFDESIVVYLCHDIANIPSGGTEFWRHTIMVRDKYSTCREDSSFNENGSSCLEIRNPQLNAMTPKNVAFFSTQTDGSVYKYGSFTIGVDVGYSLSYKNASISLSVSYERGGSADLNDQYQSYINSDTLGYSRNMGAQLDSRCALRDIGQYYTVTNSLRDYGNTTTTSESIYANWTFDVYNLMSMTSRKYTKTESLTCRVS